MAYIDTLRFWLGWIPKLIKPTKIIGDKHLVDKKVIYSCNHQSNWDMVVFFANLKLSPVCLYKVELAKNRLYKKLFDKLHHIPVVRGESDLNAFKSSLKVLKNGGSLIICPEGTRNRSADLLPFKEGVVTLAIKTKTPIRPFYISQPFTRGKKIGKVYLVVGEEFELTEYYDTKPTSQDLQQANSILMQKTLDLKDKLFSYLAENKK